MEIEIGQLKSDLHCICSDPDGCRDVFCRGEIEKCLGPKGFRLYDNVVQQQCLKAAKEGGFLEGYEECVWCSFGAVYDRHAECELFRCQNPDCSKVTCRSCKKEGHVGLSFKGT
jgi:TRIAD3 protein (E3 ubiquitin-protein ligase RNF216)